ncbi:MAG: DUF4279 domain-containing protein [Clostridiales bacterium]|nr:DUF4279 domain-containing protein [Clostridiales bacterium]
MEKKIINVCFDLQIAAKSFDVKRIVDITGLIPNYSTDVRYNYHLSMLDRMKEPSERMSYCSYSTRYIQTDDINIPLGKFLEKFIENADELNNYLKTCDFPSAVLYAIIEPAVNELYSVNFSADTIRKLSKINCRLSLEFLAVGGIKQCIIQFGEH